MKYDPENEEDGPHGIRAEPVLGYVVIGCFIVAILGMLSVATPLYAGQGLLASAAAFGVIAYIYRRRD